MLSTVCMLVALCFCKNLLRFWFRWGSPNSCIYFRRDPVYMGAKGEAYNIWMSKVVWGLSICRRRYYGACDVFHPHCPCLFLIPFYSYSSLWKVTCIFFILYYTVSVAVLLTLLSSYLCYLVLPLKVVKICKMLQDAYHEERECLGTGQFRKDGHVLFLF